MRGFTIIILMLLAVRHFDGYGYAAAWSKSDSLLGIVQAAKVDSTTVKAYIALAELNYLENPLKAEAYCKTAFGIAEKCNYKLGISTLLGWLAFLSEQKGENRVALAYYKKSLIISEKFGYKKQESTILNNMAAIYSDFGQLDSALQLNNRSLAIKIKMKDSLGISSTYNNIGFLLQNQGKIQQATEYYMKSLAIEEKLNNENGIASTLENLTFIYKEQKQFGAAFKMAYRALAIYTKQKDKYGMGYIYNSIGGLFELTNRIDSALINYDKSLAYRLEIDDKPGIAYSYKNLGSLQLLGKQVDKALVSLTKSYEAFTLLQDKGGLCSASNKLGQAYFLQGQLDKALKYYNESLALANELGKPADQRNVAYNLQAFYRQKKDWKQALLMNDFYIQMRDSIVNMDNHKAIIQTQIQYEYDRKANALKLAQAKKDASASAELSKQKTTRNAFIIGFLLVLVLIALLYNRFQIKQRANAQLSKTLQDLKDTQFKLVQSEKMASLGQLTAGVAHEINNPINFISANLHPLKLNTEDILSVIDKYEALIDKNNLRGAFEEIAKYKKEIDFEYTLTETPKLLESMDDGVQRTLKIVKGLQHFAKHDIAQLEKVNLNDLIEATLLLLESKIIAKGIQIERHFDQLPLFACQPTEMSQVFGQIILNAIDAIEKDGLIKITTQLVKNTISISIQDNGVGIPSGNLSKVFDPFFTTKPVGSGVGLGLASCFGIIEKHKGKIEVNSIVNEGATFTIELYL